MLNVFTGEIETKNIAIFRKKIAGLGDYDSADEEIDVKGMYVIPGLIDAHLHIESSMLVPRQFAKAVLLRGTTTVIADPHEIANVLGTEGITYMLDTTEGIPLNVYIGLPSAVPATDFETSGASITADDMIELLDKYPKRIVALGEVMNYPGVLKRDRELMTKIEILRHKYKKIDGHTPGLTGKELNAYIDAFIRSDHELTTAEEALEKIRRGMQVFIREGTAAKDLMNLLPAVTILNHHFFSFCTDDRVPLEILERGHLDYLARTGIAQGLDPIIAIRMATINTARYFNLRSMGAIAPGYKADMLVLDDLKEFNIRMVIKDGKLLVRDGELVSSIEGTYNSVPERMGEVKLPAISVDDLKVRKQGDKIRAIEMFKHNLFTKELITEPNIANGLVIADPDRDIAKVVVFDRHRGEHFSIGSVKGLGIRRGAIGTSVGHDSHNLAVVGANDEDILVAAKEVQRMGGGMTVILNGRVLASLPLPIAGLMSNWELFEVVTTLCYHSYN